MISEPPGSPGVNVTETVVFPVAVAVPMVGALGWRNDLVFCEALVPIKGI
jgi:hypothetical protein